MRRIDRSQGSANLLATLCALLASAVSAAPPASGPGPLDGEIARLEGRGVKVGLFAAKLGEERPFVARGQDAPLIPASTVKLVTTACALDELGPTRRFVTRLLAASPPAPDGTIRGALHWEGSGDPGLRGEDLFAIGRRLAVTGITAVEGGLSAPPAAGDGEGHPSPWSAPRPGLTDPYAAAIGPLSVAWNAAQLVVRPGRLAGAPAAVDFFPLVPGTPIDARVTTSTSTAIDVKLLPATDDSPARLTVRGKIAVGAPPRTRWIRLGTPSRAFLGAASAALDAAGIVVKGPFATGPIPERSTLIHEHEGRTLAELVRDVNKYSSNFGAEMLLRAVGRDSSGAWGTEAGLAALRACATRLTGAPLAERLHDGSGYSRRNRLTARGLARLIDRSSVHAAWGPEFTASLPLAGEDGSLDERLGTLRGRLRAKTGTLSGVSSLAGLYVSDLGERFVFAIILNGEKGKVGPADVDRVVAKLARAIEEQASDRPPE